MLSEMCDDDQTRPDARIDGRTNVADGRTLSFFSALAYASSALAASVAMMRDDV